MKLVYSKWMKELDSQAINNIGIPSIVLMENASRGAADFFSEKYDLKIYKNIVIIVGKGNNGGDGIACGRRLSQKGYNVEFVLLSTYEKFNIDPEINFDIIKKLNLDYSIIKTADELKIILQNYNKYDTFLVDSIFGIGINKPVKKGFYFDIINLINEFDFKIASIDIPSGILDVFFPEEGAHINADITATFQNLKLSHIFNDGNKYCGNIRIIDIGIPKVLVEQDKYYINLIEPSDFRNLFQKREIDAHKGKYGHVLNVSGSIQKPGAGVLSSRAILKAGAGLCTAAVCKENRTLVINANPEIMILVYIKDIDIINRLNEFDCILTGPGLEDNDNTYEIVSMLIKESKVPLILDADSINVLKNRKEILKLKRAYPIIITPHLGEFSRLTGLSVLEIGKNRIDVSREFAMEFNVFLVLKSHNTLIATPEGNVYVNQTGNPGMATAGSGDVLAGIIAGFVSQFIGKYSLDVTLEAAVFLHGFSGDMGVRKKGEKSLIASDIIDCFSDAILNLDDFKSQFEFS